MESLGAGASGTRSRHRRRGPQRGALVSPDVPTRVRRPRRRTSAGFRRAGTGRLRRRAAHRRRVNAPLVQRALWLAGITLIAALVALAITRRDAGSNRNLPRAIAVPGTKNGYYS